jgi:hypothetical protein
MEPEFFSEPVNLGSLISRSGYLDSSMPAGCGTTMAEGVDISLDTEIDGISGHFTCFLLSNEE